MRILEHYLEVKNKETKKQNHKKKQKTKNQKRQENYIVK